MPRAVRTTACVLALILLGLARASGQEVQIAAGSVGAGGMARQADWAGVEIEMTDSSPTQREVILQIEGWDSDGDTPLHQRTVTTNPGVTQRTWLYLWIPGTLEPREPMVVSAYEAIAIDPESAARTGVNYRRGELLGRQEITPGRGYLPPEIAVGLVVGRRVAGLADYARRAQGSENYLPGGHEVTEFATDLEPEDLPDRWAGLAAFENIVWTTANPADLTSARSEALIEWVRRGGHLVICLPATGQVWQDAQRNPLASILPAAVPVRLDPGTSDVRALLTHDETMTIPETLVVHALAASAAAEAGQAEAILTDRAGRVVVSRRLVDLGMVTLIGIDVTNRNLVDRGLPTMDAFWHRVLGKRGRPMERVQGNTPILLGREVRSFDADIASAISSSGSAGAALLLGFAVFGLYWAVGGPVGYAVLKKLGVKKHAWMLFIAAIGLFTLVGWGGVSILRPREARVQLVAFVDGVQGSPMQRVRAYTSVFIPGYSDAGLRVGSPGEEEYSPFHPVVTPWTEHLSSIVKVGAFPDARGYAVQGRDPDRVRFPARATEKRFRLDWAGESRWSMPRPAAGSGQAGRIRLDGAGRPSGTLVHDLPGPLRNAVVVVVRGQRSIGSATGLPAVSIYEAYRLSSGWLPGQELDLASILASDPQSQRRASEYFDDLSSRARSLTPGLGAGQGGGSDNDRLIASAFVSQLRPPQESDRNVQVAGLRQFTHGLDLGRWITQPCVIVLGVVEIPPGERRTNPIPVSLQRNGNWNEMPWSGKVVVRWVYPLEPDPPTWMPTGTLPRTDDGTN